MLVSRCGLMKKLFLPGIGNYYLNLYIITITSTRILQQSIIQALTLNG